MISITSFQIGLIVAIIGVIWIGYEFSQGEKITQQLFLDPEQTAIVEFPLQNMGIGFYLIFIPEFSGETIFVQILDPDENMIVDKKIETKKAVNYFDFNDTGIYIMKLTNLSTNSILVESEIGNVNDSGIRNPGIILFVGLIIILVSSYNRLKNFGTKIQKRNS